MIRRALLILLIATAAFAESGSVRPQCCGGSGGARVSTCPVAEPPCTDFACYVGDGQTTQRIETTNGCSPDFVWLHRKDFDDPGLGVFRTRDMAVGESYRAAPGSAVFTNGIIDFDATGFTVGNRDNGFETNTLGQEYCYYLWHRQGGWFDYGSYDGNGDDDAELQLDFKPDVMMIYGANLFDRGLRIRTASMTGPKTVVLDAADFVATLTDEIQAFKDVALGDTYTGAELGVGGNAAGRPYFWFAWKVHDQSNWIFTGSYNGTGGDGDGSEHTVDAPCRNRLLMAMTAGDPLVIPASIRFFARYYRHYAVAPSTTNWAQRFDAPDSVDLLPPGDTGGWRRFETLSFTLGNANGIALHMANMIGTTYHYWGLCE